MSNRRLLIRYSQFLAGDVTHILKSEVNEFRTLLVKKGIKGWTEVEMGISLVLFYRKEEL